MHLQAGPLRSRRSDVLSSTATQLHSSLGPSCTPILCCNQAGPSSSCSMEQWPGIRGSDGVEMVENRRQESSAHRERSTGRVHFRVSAGLALGPGLLFVKHVSPLNYRMSPWVGDRTSALVSRGLDHNPCSSAGQLTPWASGHRSLHFRKDQRHWWVCA